jgi:hypothetical protein
MYDHQTMSVALLGSVLSSLKTIFPFAPISFRILKSGSYKIFSFFLCEVWAGRVYVKRSNIKWWRIVLVWERKPSTKENKFPQGWYYAMI